MSLGGVGYAAISLPNNSVGTAQLSNNAVTNSKIKNNAVSYKKIQPGAVGLRARQHRPAPGAGQRHLLADRVRPSGRSTRSAR